jgi:hypothetical protein
MIGLLGATIKRFPVLIGLSEKKIANYSIWGVQFLIGKKVGFIRS